MIKFLVGMVAGGAIVYAFTVYPTETKAKLSQGVEMAASGVAAATSAGASAAQSALKAPSVAPATTEKGK
jgi:hypothetical protein